MRAMAFVWGVILVGGITYFSIIGLNPSLMSTKEVRQGELALALLPGDLPAGPDRAAIAGHDLYNEEAVAHGESTISFWRYLSSSSFGKP